jgi:Uma2 family endonuclease
MHLALPELTAPATLILDREHPLSDDDYFAFCQANPDLRIERTAQGEIVIVPPAGGESDYRSLEAGACLRQWAKSNGRGKAFGTSVEFILPDGAALSPDSAWVSNQRLSALTKAKRREFLRLVPEFVIEVMSPSDRLKAAQAKMSVWMANGVELAWLIDADVRTVYVYRAGHEPRTLCGIAEIAGEGSMDGFVLKLDEIWAGL